MLILGIQHCHANCIDTKQDLNWPLRTVTIEVVRGYRANSNEGPLSKMLKEM